MSGEEKDREDVRLLLERHVVPDTLYNMAKQAVDDRTALLAERAELQNCIASLKIRLCDAEAHRGYALGPYE